MKRIRNFINHIKNGTLGDRLIPPLKKYIREERKKLWHRKTMRQTEFLFPIYSKTRIFLYSDCELSKAIFLKNFEVDEITFLSKYLKEGDRFLDIGSNFGYYTLIASNLVGTSGKVYAIEPATKTYNRLLRNVELNKAVNVIPIKLAVSEKKGKLPMNVSRDGYDAWNSLTKPDATGEFFVEEVETDTIDGLIENVDDISKIKMMKIDVEGWEVALLKGGENFFNKPNAPIFQIEFNDRALTNAGYSSQFLFDSLLEMGFGLYKYNCKTNSVTEVSYHGGKIFDNYYAIKPLLLDRVRENFTVITNHTNV